MEEILLTLLHIDFGTKQLFKGLFTGGDSGEQYRHLKVLDLERTNHFVQDSRIKNKKCLPQREIRETVQDELTQHANSLRVHCQSGSA